MIYLDNSATTKPCDTAIKYINNSLGENWGNPSSLHIKGVFAEETLIKARADFAKSIGAQSNEIYFTSGGTEANNIAILGAAQKLKRRGNKIITSSIEHPSVKETIDHLEKEGYEIIRLAPDRNGVINSDDLYSAIDDKTILVSIMLVNNEIGSIEPIEDAAKAITKKNSPALLHCDAVQGYGKLPIDVKKLGVDLLSVSGHKIHGPKGSGFLFIKKGVLISSPFFGGGQESGIRSGTQSTHNIAGFHGALKELPNIKNALSTITELRDYAVSRLSEIEDIKINSSKDSLPYILNISVMGYKSETILHYLESKDIYVSSGSACSKGKKSYVLESIGLSDKVIDSSIRISFSRFNNKNEIDTLIAELKNATKFLRKAY